MTAFGFITNPQVEVFARWSFWKSHFTGWFLKSSLLITLSIYNVSTTYLYCFYMVCAPIFVHKILQIILGNSTNLSSQECSIWRLQRVQPMRLRAFTRSWGEWSNLDSIRKLDSHRPIGQAIGHWGRLSNDDKVLSGPSDYPSPVPMQCGSFILDSGLAFIRGTPSKSGDQPLSESSQTRRVRGFLSR